MSSRTWKLNLIEKDNPIWEDLCEAYSNWIPAFAGMTKVRHEVNVEEFITAMKKKT